MRGTSGANDWGLESFWSRLCVALHLNQVVQFVLWLWAGCFFLLWLTSVILAVLACCFVGAVASSVAVRRYMLEGISENQVLPVELHTSHAETNAIRSGAALSRLLHDTVTEMHSDARQGQRLESAHLGSAQHQKMRTTCDGNVETLSSRHEGCGDHESNHPKVHVDVSSEDASVKVGEDASLTSVMWDSIRERAVSRAAEAFQRREDAILALGVARIRRGDVGFSSFGETVQRHTDAEWQEHSAALVPRSLFSSHDDLRESLSSLFEPTPRPLFHAQGSYRATLQLVYLAEPEPRPVSISVHMTMLADIEGGSSTHPSRVDVVPVFHRVQSTAFLSGDPLPTRSWLLACVRESLEWTFVVPLWVARLGARLLSEDSSGAQFPALGERGTLFDKSQDVMRSVEIPLYEQFRPPMVLQGRLSAVNLTIFQKKPPQSSSSSSSSSNVHLVRAHIAFQVELEGLAYYLISYPLLSTTALTAFFFVSYALWCGCVAIGLLSGGVYLAVSWRSPMASTSAPR